MRCRRRCCVITLIPLTLYLLYLFGIFFWTCYIAAQCPRKRRTVEKIFSCLEAGFGLFCFCSVHYLVASAFASPLAALERFRTQTTGGAATLPATQQNMTHKSLHSKMPFFSLLYCKLSCCKQPCFFEFIWSLPSLKNYWRKTPG